MDDELPNEVAQGRDTTISSDRFVSELRVALTGARVTNALAITTSANRLLELIVRTSARAIPSPEGALFLIDHERQVLTFDTVIGQTAATVKELTVPLGHGIAGLVAVSGQALAIANAQDDPRHARDIAAQAGYFPTTILAVPVLAPDGTIVGVLELLDRQGQPSYNLVDMDLLGVFAQQVTIVLEQRRAYASVATLVGQTLAALGGLSPAIERDIAEQVAIFAAAVEADPLAQRTIELAQLIVAIASHNAAASEASLDILRALARYLESTPMLGREIETFQ